MANKLQVKRSSVPGKVPTTTDLDLGEIAINTYDGKVYMKKNVSGVETIVLLTGAGAGDVLGPAASADKAIARFSGTGGKTIQNSSATIDDNGNITSLTHQATGTGANKMPVGTTAQRPASPTGGEYRFNQTTNEAEYYNPNYSAWFAFRETPYYFVEYLVVAGGGGGGGNRSGGGGAGGYISGSTNAQIGTSISIVVGGGGSVSGKGSDSWISGWVVATGGGAGMSPDGVTTWDGGSGGGGAANNNTGGGAGVTGQGTHGGTGYGSVGTGGGGGGGANAVGANGTAGAGGNGGAGKQWLNGSYYAGGGGGGKDNSGTPGTGGTGGGGTGQAGNGAAATAGTANTGGGGGGGGGVAGSTSGAAAAGGSGVVIVRYAGSQRASGGTVTSVGGYTYHTFTTSGNITF